MPFLELLRVIASQLIVWHHLCFYGPLSDVAFPLAPSVIGALSGYARFAVQIFFVVGGMLSARSLARDGEPKPLQPLQIVWNRYRRSALPYLAMLVIAIGANALADLWMDHESISAPPTVGQLLAHAVFLQDVLDYEALTAGIWYLAVDFQLVLLALALIVVAPWVARQASRAVPVSPFLALQLLCWTLALSALFGFNRVAHLDQWGIYFFGSYFLGMLVQWTIAGRVPRALFWLYAAIVVGAAFYDWRPRLLVATATAIAIVLAHRTELLFRWPRSPAIAYLGRISYSLFLIHFPVCLVVNAAVTRTWPDSPRVALLGMVAAYLLSMVAAVVFHHQVEERLLALRPRRKREKATLVPAAE